MPPAIHIYALRWNVSGRIFLSVSAALPRGDSINYSAMINRLSAKFYIPARLARRLIGALKNGGQTIASTRRF